MENQNNQTSKNSQSSCPFLKNHYDNLTKEMIEKYDYSKCPIFKNINVENMNKCPMKECPYFKKLSN